MEAKPVYNASDRKDIRRAEKAAALHHSNKMAFLRAAMGSSEGRAWFHDLLTFCHLFSDPFTGNALQEAYSKGERNVGLALFADIVRECPDQYLQMMREANARSSAFDNATTRDHDPSTGADDPADDWPGDDPGLLSDPSA